MLSRTSSRSSSSVISSSSTEELVERTSEKQIRLPTVVSLASSSTKKSDSSTSNQENLLERRYGSVSHVAANAKKNTSSVSTTQELTSPGFPLDIWFEILDRIEEAGWTQKDVCNLYALGRTSKSFSEQVKTFITGRPELSIQINRLFSEVKISGIATSRIANLADIHRRTSDFRKTLWQVSEGSQLGAFAFPIIGAFALAGATVHAIRKKEIKIKMKKAKNSRDVKFTLSEVRQHDLKTVLSCAIKGEGTLLVDAAVRRGQSCDSVINALWTLNFLIGKYGSSREVYIELIGSDLSDQHLAEISQLSNNGFASIDFSDNRLSDIAIMIATLLPKWDLKRLILSNNRVSDAGAVALAKALSTEIGGKSVLAELRLDGNPVSPTGARALAIALQTNSTLSVLSLSVEAIDAKAAKALLEALMVKATPFKLILIGKLDDSIKGIFDKNKFPKQVQIDYVPDRE